MLTLQIWYENSIPFCCHCSNIQPDEELWESYRIADRFGTFWFTLIKKLPLCERLQFSLWPYSAALVFTQSWCFCIHQVYLLIISHGLKMSLPFSKWKTFCFSKEAAYFFPKLFVETNSLAHLEGQVKVGSTVIIRLLFLALSWQEVQCWKSKNTTWWLKKRKTAEMIPVVHFIDLFQFIPIATSKECFSLVLPTPAS